MIELIIFLIVFLVVLLIVVLVLLLYEVTSDKGIYKKYCEKIWDKMEGKK